MSVIVVQRIEYEDGTFDDDERVVEPPQEGDSDRRILARKILSARRYGWSYEYFQGVLRTWKDYPEGPVLRKTRVFRLED